LWVELIPTARDFEQAASRELGGQASRVGSELGSRMGATMTSELGNATRDAGRQVENTMTSAARSAGTATESAMSPAAKAVDAVKGSFTALGSGVRTVGTQMGEVARDTESTWTKVGSALRTAATTPVQQLGQTFSNFGLNATAAVGLVGIGVTTLGVRFDAAREQSLIAFTTMLHSGQAAHEMLDALNHLAATTPFELTQVTTAAQRLLAYGFQAQDLIPTLTAIGDAVSGLGGDAAMLDRVTMAIGQMAAKGKVQSDEILQLTEAGIPALRILANQMGISTEELQKMITKGLVPAATAIPQLLSGIEKGTHGAAGETMAFAGMMQAQSTTLAGQWSNFVDNSNKALGQLFEPAMPGIKAALGSLTTWIGQVPETMSQIGSSGFFTTTMAGVREVTGGIRAMFAAFRAGGSDITSSGVAGFMEAIGLAARHVWDALSPVVGAFLQVAGSAIVGTFRALSVVLDPIGSVLVTISTWLRPLTPLIVAFGAAFAAWYVIGTVTTIVGSLAGMLDIARGAITGVIGAWRLLQAAFIVSPIGVVVALLVGLVAAVIYAWTHFQGFRDVVMAVWHGIETAGRATWAWLQGAFAWLGSAGVAVGHAFAAGWHGIEVAFQAVGAAAVWLWRTILQPAFQGIALAAEIAFLATYTLFIAPWVFAFRQIIAPVVNWLWREVVEPAANAIGGAFHRLYDYGIKPSLDLARAAISGIGDLISWWWRGTSEILSWIGGKFHWLYDTAVKIVGDLITAQIYLVGAVVTWLNNNIVQPVITWVGNKFHWLWETAVSIVGGFIHNEIVGWGNIFTWLNTNIVQPVFTWIGDKIRWTHDNVIAPVMRLGGDAVFALGLAFDRTADWIGVAWDKVKAAAAVPINFVIERVYDDGIRATWNWIAEHVGLGNLDLPYVAPIRLAAGGLVPGIDTGEDTVPALLRPGELVLSPEQLAGMGGANAVMSAAGTPGMSGLGPDGMLHAGIGAWISDNILTPIGHAAEAAWSTVQNIGGVLVDFASDPVGSAGRLLNAIVGDATGALASAGDFGQMALGIPGHEVGMLVNKLRDWWASMMAPAGGGGGPIGGGVQRWSGVVLQALAALGQPASWLSTVLRRMNQESGGNPRAINLTDSNAQKGDPSRGLMQTIMSTFQSYRNPAWSGDIYDPLANTYAGLNYAIHRYGSLAALNRPGGYDSGGYLPPGLSLAYNGTAQPEPVLTGDQFDRLSGSGGPIVEIHISGDGMSPSQVASEVERRLMFALR
jgi:tape measure domain-containing protein